MSNNTKSLAAILMAMAAVGCSDGGKAVDSVAGPNASRAAAAGTVYTQVEELGNPLVSEVTIVKARHRDYDATMPYATASFKPETESFIVTVGGRPASYATTIANVLYPDVLVVNTAKSTSTAGWLSWALSDGWGGRKLSDDVVDIGLSAIFSSLLISDGHSCAPFHLPLCTDNVPFNDKPFLTVFPYVAAPTT